MSEIHPQPTTQHHLDRHEGHEQAAATAQAAPTSVEPVTPQDTHAAGAATGEQRDLLQKNVSGSDQEGAAERAKKLEDQAGGTTAGYHSTGSSTGTTGGQ
jgi:hypothetical protein